MNTENPIERKFLPLGLSKKLASLGFDEECFAYFEIAEEKLVIFFSNLPLTEEQKERPGIYDNRIKNSSLPQWAVSSPLYQDVEEWFFEKHKLFNEKFMDDDGSFGFLISKPFDQDGIKGRLDYPIQRQFQTINEAKNACIESMINIVIREKTEIGENKPVSDLMRKLSLLDSDRISNTINKDDSLKKIISEEANKFAKRK
jgi:hypothetical protein